MIARAIGQFDPPQELAGALFEFMQIAPTVFDVDRCYPDMGPIKVDPLDMEQLTLKIEDTEQLGMFDRGNSLGRSRRNRQTGKNCRPSRQKTVISHSLRV